MYRIFENCSACNIFFTKAGRVSKCCVTEIGILHLKNLISFSSKSSGHTREHSLVSRAEIEIWEYIDDAHNIVNGSFLICSPNVLMTLQQTFSSKF